MQQKIAKTKQKLSSVSRRTTLSVLAFLLIATPVSTLAVRAATCSSTSDCQSQINNLNSANSNAQSQLSSLAGQAGSYQQAISGLQSQIDAVDAQISADQAKQASLNQNIAANKAELERQRGILSSDLKAMYVDGQMSTIEMLATSKDLSSYVDKEENRQVVQNQISDTMTKITNLQKDLQQQEAAVAVSLANEQTSQAQLDSERAAQAQLLAYNSSQQANYNAQISANRSSISSLQSRLAALNTTAGSKISISGTCGGGYPAKASGPRGYWGCNYAQDNTVDNWNMLNRECVSYTAWMVYSKYGISTSGWGSAYKWIAAAESRGYRVDQTPTAGSIAIRDVNYSEPGDVGHAMYVTDVNSAHDITVWEYNRSYTGTFDQREFDPYSYSAPVYYIHFN